MLQVLCGSSPGTPEVVHSWVQSWHCLTLWDSRWEVSKVRGWLFLAAVSVPLSRWDLAFFQGDTALLIVLPLETDPIANRSKGLFVGLWHVFYIFSICFMLMLLFSFDCENTKRRTEARFRLFSSLFSPKYKGHYSQ